MTPELRAAIDKLPDDIRQEVAAVLEEGERAKAAAMFEDMGYEDCDVCRQSRLRASFHETCL